MNLQITPLTPLWTGDAKRKGDHILETGVLGSLRWWYEVLIRGLGYYACDPGGGTCEYKEKEGSASVCAVCQLFGCTGYGRRFRLLVHGGSGAGPLVEVKLKSRNTDNPGWRIPTIVSGPLTLSVLPMGSSDRGEVGAAALRCTLRLVEQYGALGGKTSHGQGVVKIEWAGDHSAEKDFALLREELAKRHAYYTKNPVGAPDLRDLVGATILLEDDTLNAESIWQALSLAATKDNKPWNPPLRECTWVPSSPAIRSCLRQWLREKANFPEFTESLVRERHRLMGTTKQWGDPQPQKKGDRPKGSDIFVTHFYKVEGCWTMRIFAFIPREGNEVENTLRALLSDRSGLEGCLEKTGLPLRVVPYPADLLKAWC
ncbi:MAG: type III-B CRISPR module RAMP protein Cmr1 [Peptococcaceae bacterium]|jgi:CRISPR type III-B/RAMP module RAMP protein Cmr1|nr:type III-B CRISPR module RAMP protein Cmr1 [Peptococcaceae bacterium]